MQKNWVAIWGCPIAKPARNVAQWICDTTVRFNFLTTVSGTAVKLHFSNLFGTHQASITKATVSVSKGERNIDEERLAEVTFLGKDSGTMAPGGDLSSDEIPFSFEAGETLSVSLYFGEFAQMTTGHQNGGEFIEKWVVTGDYTHSEALPPMENVAADSYPFIHTIEAICDEKCFSVVAFGDSITAQTWPDRLVRNIHKENIRNVSVVRKGISGSRVLREYPCTSYQTYGPKGIDSFERSVLLAGVKKIIVLHGINDIIHPEDSGNNFRPLSDLPTPEDLIEGYRKYIRISHNNDKKIYLATILPFEGWRTYNEEKNRIRLAVNEWIRTSGEADGVIDFEKALMDPMNNNRLEQLFDSGDHLHPSAAGAQAMADLVISEKIL